MSNFSDLDFALSSRSIRDRVLAKIHNGSLRDFDFGGYDFSWLDSRDVVEIRFQLEWLEEAAAECRVDGDHDSAEAWKEVLEAVREEMQNDLLLG